MFVVVADSHLEGYETFTRSACSLVINRGLVARWKNESQLYARHLAYLICFIGDTLNYVGLPGLLDCGLL